ncbi:MAG: 4Fe-4S binding protein [Saprospiraceae bacterium]|nr:4Fe-4S binding protein [Saprospiraceae bacterium]
MELNHQTLAVINPGHSTKLRIGQKLSLSLVATGLMGQLLFWLNHTLAQALPVLVISITLISLGSLTYTWQLYRHKQPGISNDYQFTNSLTAKGSVAWVLAMMLTVFYIILYWFPQWLGLGADGQANTGLIALYDPLSFALKGKSASQWFVYGSLYTMAIDLLGIKFIWKYRHSRYQVYRTLSIIFFQTCFAFILPEIMQSLNQPYFDLKNLWPLNYYFFFDWHLDGLIKSGLFGYFLLFWGLAGFLVFTPVLTWLYGKRWYCSWVCGCGGLAETAGDTFRHLSDKSQRAWKWERRIIYGVLVFVVVMTLAVITTRLTGFRNLFIIDSGTLAHWYGFLIGAAFSGVVGVGFYPIMGSRVWCRFGCPMAAYLGILQKYKSRFRITTNGGQCISCGNCSTYCEMGIDVKAYAQKGQDILRASCVGCGVCSAVCPRGVLRLENGG